MTFDDNFVAISQDYLAPKVVDTVLRGNLLLNRLMSNGKPWRGEKYSRPIQVSQPVGGKSFSGLERFSTEKSNTKVKMQYDVRAYTQPVVIEGIERDVNNSDPGKAAGLIDETMEEAGNTMLDTLGTILYSDGTGATGGTGANKDFLGLKALDDDGTTVSTIGGLSRSTYITLKSKRYSVTGGLGLTSLSTLATAESATRAGNDVVTVHITSDARWSDYEALLTPMVRNNIDSNGYSQATRFGVVKDKDALRGEAGFDALYYRGKPVVADQKCPDANWWGLNEKTIIWAGLPSADDDYKVVNLPENKEIESAYSMEQAQNLGISFGKFQKPIDQYGMVAHFIVMGNFMVFNPIRDFVVYFS